MSIVQAYTLILQDISAIQVSKLRSFQYIGGKVDITVVALLGYDPAFFDAIGWITIKRDSCVFKDRIIRFWLVT